MRLTLDFDDPTLLEQHLDTIRERYSDKPWELRQSSGGTGYHIIVYDLLDDTRAGVESNQNLREVYDDDPKRLKLDKMRWSEGSPFYQVLYRRKYMDRDDFPTEEGTGYSTGHAAEVIEQSDAVKAAPKREKIKDDSGNLMYRKIAELLVQRYGGAKALAEKQGVSRRTVYRWLNGESEPGTKNRKGLRRKARSQAIGHYAETEDGSGRAAEDVRFVDVENERRTLVEYVDVPLDWDIGGDDREYGLLNTHTGSFHDKHTDQQLHRVHNGSGQGVGVEKPMDRRGVTDQALAVLSPRNPSSGQELRLDDQNTHFTGISGWTREQDSVNYEREIMDEGERDVYIDNLPKPQKQPEEPEKSPLFEVILWNEDMTDTEWHVIGIWAGSDPSDAIILKDDGIGSWDAA